MTVCRVIGVYIAMGSGVDILWGGDIRDWQGLLWRVGEPYDGLGGVIY
jgi:hypothetical protein